MCKRGLPTVSATKLLPFPQTVYTDCLRAHLDRGQVVSPTDQNKKGHPFGCPFFINTTGIRMDAGCFLRKILQRVNQLPVFLWKLHGGIISGAVCQRVCLCRDGVQQILNIQNFSQAVLGAAV